MPLYDGDMVNLLTPDGRAVSMPSGLAGMFPGLGPAPAIPDVAGPGGAGPDQAPPSDPAITGPAAPPPAGSPAAPQGPQEGPVTDPSQLAAPTGTPSRPQGPVTTPAEDTGTPRQPTPAPVPTNQQLAKNYAGRAVQESDRAADEERAGVIASARVQADEATREGARLAQRDAETERLLQERAKQAAANEAELNARISARDQLADQIAKTRIDRSVDHPIWAQIGLVISMLGTAMTRRPGEAWSDPAYNTLMQLVERKVQGQVQDLDQKRQSLAQMNVGVAEQRQHNLDRLTEIDARRDAALQQAQQAVQTIATQMKAPAALAGAQQLLGKLDQERAKLHADFGQKAQDQINTEAARAQTLQMHRESLGVTIRGQNMEQARFETQVAATEREKMAEIAQRALAAGDKVTAERAKAVQERSVGDPRTGYAILGPAGVAKMKQADQAEAAARQQQDPQQAQKLREYAAALRQSAQLNDAALAPTAEAQKELTKQVTAAQDITDRISDAMAKLEAGPGVMSREAWASITTDLGNIAGKYQQAMGERVSTKAFEQTMTHILNFDPDSLFQRAASKGKAIESLKTLKGMIASDVNGALKANRIQTDWQPVAKGEEGGSASFNADEKTATEIGQDENPGILQRAGARIMTAGMKGYDDFGFQDQAAQAARDRPGSEAGLSPNATTHIKALAARAQIAGDAEHDRIVQTLANPISAGLREGGRNSLAMGMLEVLRNSNPAVYADVVNALPASDQKEIRGIDSKIRKAPDVPNTPSGFDPDAAAAAQEERDRAATAAAARSAKVRAEQREKFGDLGAAK